MKRKIVKHGPGTLTISIPSKWAKKNGLSEKDEVDIEERGKNLILTIDTPNTWDKKNIDISNLHPLINRTIIKLYQSGVDEIHANFNNTSELNKLREVSSELIGYEIVEQKKNLCIIKDVAKSSDQEFKIIFRKLFFILKDILKESQIAIRDKNKEVLDELILRDYEINRFANYCIRVLNKKSFDCTKESYNYFMIIHLCEKSSDIYKDILRYITKNDVKLDNNFYDLHKRIILFFNHIDEFVFNKDLKVALRIAKEYESLRKELFLSHSNTFIKVCLRNFIDIIVMIQELNLANIKGIKDA